MSKKFYFIFVFITGAAIMMLEMVAFKITVPYFGSSLFIWANIIGLVMIALSVGYYFGGKFVDKHPDAKYLMYIVLGAGLYSGAISFFSQFFRLKPMNVITGSFLYILLLFVPPIFLLGAVSPFVTRLLNLGLETTGQIAGKVYAFSTIGSVFGTFFSSFLAIPFLGIKKTLFISGLVLLTLGISGLFLKKEKHFTPKESLLSLLIFLILLSFQFSFPNPSNIIYEKESFYGLVQVKKMEDGIYLDINSSGRWSVYHPKKILTNMYFDYFLPLYYLLDKKENIDMLIIGHAGGVFSRQYSHFFGDRNIRIDGVELDPEVTRVAYKYFDIGSYKGLKVINEDGRIFLQKTNKKYDLILIDAIVGNLYIPFQLATKEFFELTNEHLKGGGILAQTIIAPGKNSLSVQCLISTAGNIYPYIYLFELMTQEKIKTPIKEIIMIASQKDLAAKILNLKERTNIDQLRILSEKISGGIEKVSPRSPCVLTDDRDLIEILGTMNILPWVLSRR